MYAARRSGLKREMFGYLPGGYNRILAALEQRLEALGVEIHTGCRVERVERDEGGQFTVTRQDGELLTCDRVVVTTAAPLAARMCPQLTALEVERLDGVEYLGILCASLLLRKPLAGYYVTNITDPAPFTGVIEMTALVDPAEFGGRTLVYLPKYATSTDPAWARTDDQLRSECLEALQRLFPGFSGEDVLAFRVSRVRHVFALTTLDYSRRLPPVETSIPGLFVASSAQIVNGTLNVNETVRLAESNLDLLCQPLPVSTIPNSTNYAQTNRELVARPR
jgi:protoporphyrinogen oxidase